MIPASASEIRHLLRLAAGLLDQAAETAQGSPEAEEYLSRLLSDWQGQITGSLSDVAAILRTDLDAGTNSTGVV